jgi:hypothetical protein
VRNSREAITGALWLGLVWLVTISGCSDHGTDPTKNDTVDPATVSFAADLQPVFDLNCGTCHAAGGNGGLDLRQGVAWGNLVGAAAVGYAQQRVVPGRPDLSLLYLKLSGSVGVGDRMPLGGALPANELENVRIWIVEGARDN